MSELDEVLREAHAAEWETAYNYQVLADVLRTVDGAVVAEEFEADVSEEISHAQELAQRLRVRGEDPEFFVDQGRFGSQDQYSGLSGRDVKECLEAAIEAEETAIETYERLVELAGDEGDYATEDLAIELLDDEQAHRRELKDLQETFL
jgi:bacterioferritin